MGVVPRRPAPPPSLLEGAGGTLRSLGIEPPPRPYYRDAPAVGYCREPAGRTRIHGRRHQLRVHTWNLGAALGWTVAWLFTLGRQGRLPLYVERPLPRGWMPPTADVEFTVVTASQHARRVAERARRKRPPQGGPGPHTAQQRLVPTPPPTPLRTTR